METPFSAAFMIFIILWYEGDREVSFVPLVLWVLAGIGWVLALSVDDSSSFWKWNGYIITSMHHTLKERKRKRNVCMKILQIFFFYFKMFLLSSIKDLDISHTLCLIESVTVRATRALANMVVFFFFFFFFALSWGGGALNSYLRPLCPCMREMWCLSQK